MIIAVDFDGTIVENRFPRIGKEISFAIETLKAFNKQGHQLILWTVRSGRQLEEAVAFCEERGVEFYAVNKSYPEEVFDESLSRKINADIFIDDRNIGGMLSWGEIYQILCPEETGITRLNNKKGFLKQIFKK
jgi:hydroxymethylpyrimidine pyrophosphatase-like HAD family hydrolase